MGYLCNVRRLESVQRRWTREVDGVGHLEYQERLVELGLYSVFGRLLRADLIKIWKIFRGGLDSELQELFERAIHPGTRGHSLKLSIPRCQTEIRRRFLGVRCVGIWNSLPDSAIHSETVNGFKSYLDVHLSDRFYCTVDGG